MENLNNIEEEEVVTSKKGKKKAAPKVEKTEEEKALEKLIKQEEKNKKLEDKPSKGKPVERIDTDITTGLSSDQVDKRKSQGLTNALDTGSTKSIPRIIFSNLFTFFNVLTFCIFLWLVSVNSIKDCMFIVVVTANVSIGIFQEIRSKLVIDKLSVVSAPVANILRDGDEYDIPVGEIVLDDILILSSGKQICTDSIVVEGMLEVNESLLTGESDAIVKKPGDLLYSGSFVVSGNCKAKAEKVGKDNFIEKLTKSAKKYAKPKSDLLGTLKLIITVMTLIIAPIGIALFYSQAKGYVDFSEAQWWLSDEYRLVVQKTAGAIIGMIPSGLFLLTSVALYVSNIRLAQNNTLVQELYCIEMLARVDVLCLDKTGTITDGTMAVKGIIEYNNESKMSVKNAVSAMLNALNESNLTSVALEEKFGRAKRVKHINTIPFSSSRKWNAVEFEDAGTYVLGAPEFVLKDSYDMISVDVEKSAENGYRVLLLAHSKGSIDGTEVKGKLIPAALILIEDTIREDAIETIKYFRENSVEVKVISGDNPITVAKVSERAGIDNANQYISLDGLTDKEVIRAATKYTVFGRVSPAQKQLLVKTIKSAGGTVAMTGDGVNDILALRESDCSIALASGSEAARNVSHLVLLDSNFGSMPKVVTEGRRVINNVQRVASLFLTKTIFSLLLALYALYQGYYPISTSQLMIIEILVIGIPSFVLALETNNNKVEGRFIFNVLRNALPGAIMILISTVLVFFITPLLKLTDNAAFERDIMTTIVVISATYTCFTVLRKVCTPFNPIRRLLFILMSTMAIALVIVLPDFFGFVPIIPLGRLGDTHMPLPGILLTLVMVQMAQPGIVILQKFIPTCKDLGQKILKAINKF